MAFPFRICAAPMAGISNRAFREIVREFGADLAYGEMISARALGYGNRRTWELMDIEGEQSPRLVQISGSEAHFVAAAAEAAAMLGAQYIDLNMGCPAPKVARNNEGCMLMRQPELAAKLVSAARSAGLPVSCKFRAGWDDTSRNAVDFARRMAAAGASFLAVHGRTRQQFYSGKADWSVIRAVKQAVDIPVVGNGDIFSAADALSMLEETGCDGVMVGRGMLGNPWLFAEIRAVLRGEAAPARPTAAEIAAVALRHLRRHIARSVYWYQQREGESPATAAAGESLAIRSLRGHLGWYTKGLRNSAQLRQRINQAESLAEIEALFAVFASAGTASSAAARIEADN